MKKASRLAAVILFSIAVSAWSQPGQGPGNGPSGGGPDISGNPNQGPGSPGGVQAGGTPLCTGDWSGDSVMLQLNSDEIKATRVVNDELARYTKAGDKDTAAAKAKLVKAVGDLFDLKLREKEHLVQREEERLQLHKDKVAQGHKDRDGYIKRRVDRLTGGGDDWDW